MKKIPVTLVTGFLGAGKSTFINRIIKEHPETKFGIVVNEFGDVNLESQIVRAGKDEITELSNGCMCCVVRSDLISAVEGLLARNPAISHIILEASGLSDPVPIAGTFINDTRGGKLRFDSILCVVDAHNFLGSIEDYLIASQQLEYADFILLSKTEQADKNAVARTIDFIRDLKPDARIHPLHPDFSTDLVIDVSNLEHDDIRALEIEEHHHHHGDYHEEAHSEPTSGEKKVYCHAHQEVDTLFYKTAQPFDLELFGDFLRRLPQSVYRAKGFMQFTDPKAQGKKYLLQLVGGRPLLESKYWEPQEERQSAMVFIGKGFDHEALRRALIDCQMSA